MSHTVSIPAGPDLGRTPGALEAAVEAMGGTIMGETTHRLYSSTEHGIGFQLPGWQYPIVFRTGGAQAGTLAFDDYHGKWGNRKDLERLHELYTIEAARMAAEAQGWMVERAPEGLTVHTNQPGKYLTVTRTGTVEAFGFHGVGCADATAILAGAIGEGVSVAKPEYFQEQCHVRPQQG